jgi:hypothetical protein
MIVVGGDKEDDCPTADVEALSVEPAVTKCDAIPNVPVPNHAEVRPALDPIRRS